jgi:hypothetical protein
MPDRKVTIRRFLILLPAAVLAGCVPLSWVDMTGHHRGGARAETDYKACSSEAGKAPGSDATFDEMKTYQQRLQICMYSHGWRPASLKIN